VFLPFADYPNPQGTPWITRFLIAANVAVYLLVSLPLERRPIDPDSLRDPQVLQALEEMARLHSREGKQVTPKEILREASSYDLFVFMHGYKPGKPSLEDLFYCMFLHGGLLHLFGNMLTLWIYGDNVEARLGRFGYLVAYLATGAIATLTFSFLNPSSMVPLVGASGAISGILGFYLLWFPDNRVKVLVWFYYWINVLHFRAVWFLLLYVIVLSNVLPILVGAEGGVAYWAHLGGFAAGVLGALLVNAIFGKRAVPHPEVQVWRKVDREERVREQYRSGFEPATDDFATALASGRMQDASYFFRYRVVPGKEAATAEDVFRLGQWLFENRYLADSADVFRFYVSRYPRGHDLDRANLALGVSLSRSLAHRAAARQYLLAAIDMARDESTAETARAELARLG
jgi:membrane associated rhomboid family serine protease